MTHSKKLLMQGWRFIHHSYALVAQAHCVALSRRRDVEVRFEALPYRWRSWTPSREILDADDESILDAIAGPDPTFAPDATVRFECDFSAPPSGRKFVFHTPEFGVLRPVVTRGLGSAADVPDSVHVLTPSRWAAMAYQRFGFGEERIHVVPHGVEPRLFHPDEAARVAMRQALGIQDRFVFLHIGGMTGNKGIDVLLRGFARTLETAPDATLVLKGFDDLYASDGLLRHALDALPASDRAAVTDRMLYFGDRRPARWMADLLRAADCYVAPYLAEGFNLPVLEAAACGLPLICTGGGPTDEFTDPEFAWRIRSRRVGVRVYAGQVGEGLQPDQEHLNELMRRAAGERDRLRPLGAKAARYAGRFTWDRMTERLVGELFG
ncbi:MAG TPA: glycosyltransferase family 4 protein [Casimicrobiaceae bacterium]|nr:glycosyltransferase family 4 protein [Casimicrobiaceae bacterium]